MLVLDVARRCRVSARSSVLLPGVRVADDREHRDVAAARGARGAPRARGAERRELALEARDAVAHAAAVDLELRLAGSAAADAAAEARERRVALREARQQVLELRELDLELAVPRSRARCAKMSRISWVRSMTRRSRRSARLRAWRGREVVVEDHEVDVVLEAADRRGPASFPAPITVRGSTCGRCWTIDVDDVDAGGARELAQLGDARPRSGARAAGGDRDEDRALALADGARPGRARELLLEGADPVVEVEVELRGGCGGRSSMPVPSRPAGARAATCAALRQAALVRRRPPPSRRGGASRGRSGRRG